MAYTLDTSGAVYVQSAHITDRNSKVAKRWSDLSPFAQGYIEALFAERFQFGVAFSDLAPETLSRIIAACGRCESGLRALGIQNVHVWSGYNVWLLQQAGSLAEHGFPPLTVTLGDDGKVRFV